MENKTPRNHQVLYITSVKEDKCKGPTIQQNDELHCWLFLPATGSVIAKKQDAENVQYTLQLCAFLSINPCILWIL